MSAISIQIQQIGIQPVITFITLGLTLACGSLNQLPLLSSQQQPLLTREAALPERRSYRLADAFKKLDRLPGYRLESRSIMRDLSGHQTELVIISRYDTSGNSHILTQTAPGQDSEVYFVAGHAYLFDPRYEGWVDQGAINPTAAQQSLAKLGQSNSLIQLLPRFTATLREAGHGAIASRAATRYELQYGLAALAEVLGQTAGPTSPDLSGLIWLDDKTGASLKLEILLYGDKARQPLQDFRLEVSQIGQIVPLLAPTPLVDPPAIMAATATAQTWAALEATLDYQGELVPFELTPTQAAQTPQVAPARVEMRLILRRLPAQLFQKTSLEPFLAALGQQLALSIPQRNATLPSQGFHLLHSDADQQTVDVLYFFQAGLEDFSYVELVLSGQGNPAFVPVPVGKKD